MGRCTSPADSDIWVSKKTSRKIVCHFCVVIVLKELRETSGPIELLKGGVLSKNKPHTLLRRRAWWDLRCIQPLFEQLDEVKGPMVIGEVVKELVDNVYPVLLVRR